MVMNSPKNGRWIIPFKKFSRLNGNKANLNGFRTTSLKTVAVYTCEYFNAYLIISGDDFHCDSEREACVIILSVYFITLTPVSVLGFAK